MARAFKAAVEAGREAFEAGLGSISTTASASSPTTGIPAVDLGFIQS
jgi:thiazole synthase